MGCGDKKRNTCFSEQTSTCTKYTGGLSDKSKLLVWKGCINVDDVVEELYKDVDDLNDKVEAEISNSCIDYGTDIVNGKIDVDKAVEKHDKILCQLLGNSSQSALNTIDITDWNIYPKCLGDECQTGLHTLKDLIQAIINKLCDCNCGN